MKLLTRWLKWFVKGREEHKFHVDLILKPGETVYIAAGHHLERTHELVIGSPDRYTKVHLSASWEYRPTEFVEE